MVTLTERFNRLLFQREVKGILNTPPIDEGENRFAVLSMVHHRDVLPYLLAIKTFAYHASPKRIFLIADPSLDGGDRKILYKHIPHLEIREAADFRRPSLPIGGTWERLSAISILCQEFPIVQLDADTMTFGFPKEVVEGMSNNQSFIIRSEGGVEIQKLDLASAFGKKLNHSSNHIQVASEAHFTELPNWENYYYVRGCSGFTGFAKAAINEDVLSELSASMRLIHGNRWDEWGTEQVSSNLLAASAPNAFLLPHPKYCNADGIDEKTIIAHYIGYARHINRNYEHKAKTAIKILLRNKQ
jgi:hypothetical protein